MRRNYLYLGLVVAVTASALIVWRSSSGAPQVPAANERRPANTLPLSQVILFNSGVGYFQREGVIEGDARVDLQFPAGDVNDLLKSLVLQDQGGGKITTVSYDGQEPIERTLKTFALDLTGNPTFGQLLNQARGEKVELTLQKDDGLASGTLAGTIVGMESQQEPGPREVHSLNLLCAEGMRCVPLKTVQRVRFLNAALDGEFHRALEVLAGAHNGQKKSVTLQFHGEGKRTVKVGYVVEAPMWKSSYRLVLDKGGKANLQGWAIVENTTDEDWKDVRLALVSSRPISFQMDLYQPLFVPRPVVEPERFASLRPPEYQGPLTNSMVQLGGAGIGGVGMMGMAGVGGIGGQGFNQLAVQGGIPGNFQGQSNLGVGGGVIGFGGQQFGQQGGAMNRYQLGNNMVQNFAINRLTYESLQQRRQERDKAREEAKKSGSALAEIDPTDSVKAAVLAETIGDQARYTIDHKINLARQRSALLPLVNQEAAVQRVSIFNDKVNSKFPLRGLKIKNATGQNLMQGPVSVYEGSAYAGDSRLPDLQAGEERLLSFAVDQAVEVKAETKSTPDEMTLVRVIKGVVEETHRVRQTTKYLIKNRSDQERTLIVEHPIDADWKLIGSEKPAERSRDFYRFEWKVPSGKSLEREVTQEQTRQQRTALTAMNTDRIGLLARGTVISPKFHEALQKAIEHHQRLTDTQRDLAQLQAQFQAVTKEQERVRTSLDKVPANTPLQKRYLEKLDKQETQFEKLQTQIEEKQQKEKQQQKELEQYLVGLTVD
jgi:hypothetical protein